MTTNKNQLSLFHPMKTPHSEQGFKAMTRSQLAAWYGVSPFTFRRWIKRAGLEIGARNMLTPKQVAEVIEKLGWPG